ncbi:diacylglycerol/lipid kinase family protein [Azospirillum thermophilum]|uniref:Diacylglycerol kinase n=1 Tax=Azospirillum thermophilum TaxID=2202148 RepID=A0A2S2CRJ9_9PROT|nr:diacylglycerol kinase family protein [Azospirillum thermophilum]AWK87141.1 diacylglycerol kinase [Azospirillum thermophilum]
MKVAIVLNQSAGSLVGRPIEEAVAPIRAAFERHGAEVTLAAVEPADCPEAIRRALDSDAEVVVVGGGDGTVNTAVNLVMRSGKVLGVIPLGTLNLLARDLNIPFDLEEAAEALAAGEVRAIDIAEVNGDYYLNSSVLGFYPAVVQERERQRKMHRLLKWPGMAVALVKTLRRLPLLDVRLDWGEGPRRVRTPVLAVSNNVYDDGFRLVVRRSVLDSGNLGVYVARHRDAWALMRLLGRMVTGTWKQDDELETLTASGLMVHSRRRTLRMVNDGEVKRMTTPLQYRIHKKALKVLAPKAAGD